MLLAILVTQTAIPREPSWPIDARDTPLLKRLRDESLHDLEPDSVVETRTAIGCKSARLDRSPVVAVGAAWARCAPDRASGPVGPADV